MRLSRFLTLVLVLCLLTGCGALPTAPSGSSAVSAPVSPEKTDPPAPTWQELYEQGTEALAAGNHEAAVKALLDSISLDPAQGKAFLSLADAYDAMGEIVKAKDARRMALEAYSGPSALTLALEKISESGRACIRTKRTDGVGGAFTICEYDAEERLLRRTDCDQQGNFSYSLPEYNEAGQIQRTTLYRVDGSVRSYDAYEYDSAGNVIRETHHWADSFTEYSCAYEYDAENRKIGSVRYDSKDAVTNRFTYEYDAEGTLIRETGRVPGGAGWRCDYNSSGKIILHTQLTPNGTEDSSASYEYAADGTLARETHRRLGAVTMVIEYDGDKHLRTTHYNADGTAASIFLSEYNADGKLIMEVTHYPDGTLLFYTDYDENGRTLSETQYRPDGSVEWQTEYSNNSRTTYYDKDGSVLNIVEH